MKTITSRSNPLYRELQADMKHAGRAGHGIWLEGVHLCQAWLAHRDQPQWAMFANEAQGNPEVDALAKQTDPARQVWVPSSLLAGLSTLATPPAVIFVGGSERVEQHTPVPLAPVSGSCVLLDDIQDPGNVGTLLRTAAAAGIRSVYAGPGTAACWSPKVLRAGQGAQFTLLIHESVDLASMLTEWAAQDKRPLVLATALDAEATSLYDLNLRQDVAWIFGHEGQGVGPRLLAAADSKVFIPHDLPAVESLNVSSAAAICLFEQRRQSLSQSPHQ